MTAGKQLAALAAIVGVVATPLLFARLQDAFPPDIFIPHSASGNRADFLQPSPTGDRAEELHGPPAKAADIVRYGNPKDLLLRSRVALVMDDREEVILYGRHIDEQRPIASITKLMTALVIMEARLPLGEPIQITTADRDTLRGSGSRLPYGAILTRYDLLYAALGGSDNRAAAALARTYPGGRETFIDAMNERARDLGMVRTRFRDPTGLDNGDISTARDLVKLVFAASRYPLFQNLSTSGRFTVADLRLDTPIGFVNTNRLVRRDAWDIGLSKTGYTSDAGNCLVMQTTIADRPVTIILLNSWGKLSRIGDSNRIRKWLIDTQRRMPDLRQAVASAHS